MSTIYYDNFRRLVCDVKNPEFDKRKRYGVEAVPGLPKGTALYEFTRKLDEGKYTTPGSVYFYQTADGQSDYTSSGFGEALIRNSVVCEPETWRERVTFAIGNANHTEGILDRLLADGTISPSQIVGAAIRQDEAEAAEYAKETE